MSKRDYYEVLGVPRTADAQQIKSAYRKLALKYHPDRNPEDATAEERFKEAAEAYAVLADSDKRTRYDQFGHTGVGATPGSSGFDPTIFADFGDIFGGLGNFFGVDDPFGGARRRGGAMQGGDLQYDLEISFEETAAGTETTIQIPSEESCGTCRGSGAALGSRPETCSQCRGRGQLRYQQGLFTVARTCGQCRGTGKILTHLCTDCRGGGRVQRERRLTVKVPAGIATGQRLRLHGEGEHGINGGPPGDLYVVVHVKEHPFFHRDGDDLLCEIPIAYPTLVLGGEIVVPTLNGHEKLTIPYGTQTNTRFRLRGKGLPNVSGRGRGNLYVAVQVEVPTKMSPEQRVLIEKLDKIMPQKSFQPTARTAEQETRPFFDRVKDIFG